MKLPHSFSDDSDYVDIDIIGVPVVVQLFFCKKNGAQTSLEIYCPTQKNNHLDRLN